MRRLAFALLLTVAPSLACAQSAPNWSYGYVPSAGEVRNAFSTKQDRLTFTPLNQAGGTMFGRLATPPSTVNGAGFAILPGIPPTLPQNGDVWMTSSGLFYQYNGQTSSFLSGSRKISTSGLATGGGTLNSDLTINVPFSSSAQALSGTDNATAITPAALAAPLALKAPVASPAFTGAASAIEGLSVSPTASHGGLTYQVDGTTAASVLGPQQPPGWFTVDGVRSVMVAKADATAQTTSAFGFYVRNEAPEVKTGATGTFGTVACVVANSACWGQNPTVIDAPQNGVVTNLQGIKLIGSEYDIQVTSPFTTVQGISVIGSSVAQPAYADGITIGYLSAQSPGLSKWSHAYLSSDGAANIGVLIGAASVSGANVSGTPNLLNYFDSSGVARAIRYRSVSDGSLAFDGVSAPNGIKVFPAVAGQFPSLVSFGTDPNPGLVLQAQGLGQVITQSLLNANKGLYVGTSAQFGAPIQLQVTTVAGLPTCNTAARGSMMAVTDATSPTYNGALTGGGTISIPVYCRGDVWTAH